jgi:phytoene dehydrogenase-like protein
VRYSLQAKGSEFDVAVIGGGPNGLTASAYLQKAGLKVILIERRYELGGTLVTEDLGGIRAHLHHNYYMVYADAMPPISDLTLSEYAVSFVKPEIVAVVHDDSEPLLLYRDPKMTAENFAKKSPDDGRAFERLYGDISQLRGRILLPLTFSAPKDQNYSATLAKTAEGKKIVELAGMSPIGVLEYYNFKDDLIKATLLYLGCRWGLEPNVEGHGDLFTHYLSGALNLAIVKGGSQMLSNGLAYAAYEAGLETFLVCEAQRIRILKGGVEVQTNDNRVVRARLVISTAGLTKTFLAMAEEIKVSSEIRKIVESWAPNEWSLFTMNSGVKEVPKFKIEEKNPNVQKALMHIFGLSSPHALLNALSSKNSEPTLFNLSIPTVFDPSQAAKGVHVLRIEAEAPIAISGGWKVACSRFSEALREAIYERVSNEQRLDFFINYVFPPEWISMKFPNIKEGSIWGGKIGNIDERVRLASLYDLVEGVIYAGHDAYPRGPLSLSQGYIAASKAVSRLRTRVWWKEPTWLIEARDARII